MSQIRVSYSLTRRSSQSRAAAAYQAILAERYEMVSTQDTADVVIVHHPPINYQTVFALHPALRDRYVISCCVPHGNELSRHWKKHLSLVQEIWTCSKFCYDILANHHPNVVLVPYVAERDFTCAPQVLDLVKRTIDYREDRYYFLAIGPVNNARKNIRGVVEAFRRAKREMPGARLIVKAGHNDSPSWDPGDDIAFLPFSMPFDYVSALYQLANAYVSAHRSEVWGLCMSDAMLRGIPVIGTAYSGNLDFMNESNSLLVDWQSAVVPPKSFDDEFEPGMTWAEPDPESLTRRMLEAYYDASGPGMQSKIAAAAEHISRFDRTNVAQLLWRRVDAATSARTAAVA